MVKAEDLMKYENELLAKGYKYICGVDEVGRGPLAGPVCVCAVIMPLDDLIQVELEYYRNIYKANGIKGLFEELLG